jgi:transcription antitermination factor NusG
MAKKLSKYVWLVININTEYFKSIKKDLAKYPEFKGISVFVPTVKIIKKQVKNKIKYERIPLLFNYGFLRVMRTKLNLELTKQLQAKIPGIYSFMRNSARSTYKPPEFNTQKHTVKITHEMPLAFTSKLEVNRMKVTAKKLGIYSKAEIDKLQPGERITLKGYPFDGLTATVVSVNKPRKKLKVEIITQQFSRIVEISFDNTLYSIYHQNYDPLKKGKEKSLEDIAYHTRNNSDKVMFYGQAH